MRREDRAAAVQRIRLASRAWQEADREMQGLVGSGDRIRQMLDDFLRGEPAATEAVRNIPPPFLADWQRTGKMIPVDFAARALPEFQDALKRKRAAEAVIYTPALLASLEGLRRHDPSGIDAALVFLEANPVCFHSGYDKQRLLRHMRHMPLTLEQQRQLRAALLGAVREGAGVEFREHGRTAERVDHPRLRRALEELRDSEDPGIQERAVWMLGAITRGDGD